MKKLTDKEERFSQAVLTAENLTDAYIAVYNCGRMKRATISRKAVEVNQKPHVAARVAELKAARCERTSIDADYVLKRLVEIDQMDVVDILEDEGGFKSISKWPKVWRSFLSGMDVSEVFAGSGDDRAIVGMMKKIKWPDKVKNLELMGKHVSVQAFRENINHSGSLEIESLTDEQLDAKIAARAAAFGGETSQA